MSTHVVELELRGPWSLRTTQAFWEGFSPAALRTGGPEEIRTAFAVEQDWSTATARIAQEGGTARIEVAGDGDLDAAAAQTARFLGLDVDARVWPEVGQRDAVIGSLQRELPGFRPCGFHSPYEAASWAVISQRTRVPVAAAVRRGIIGSYGESGAFPSPERLREAVVSGTLTLPGRKGEYLEAIAEAALEGLLDGDRLRGLSAEEAYADVLSITGIGPFGADLAIIRGANTPDVLPRAERLLIKEIARLYGADASLEEVSRPWAPFRSWACVYLRAARESRLHELG